MRGFQQMTVQIDGEDRPAMEAFDFISGLSGGNFPSLSYVFAQNTTSSEILDADGISDPTLTKEELESIPENSLFYPFVKSIWSIDSLPTAMYWTVILQRPFWSSFVYLHFLERFGVPYNTSMADIPIRSDVKATPVATFSMVGPKELYPDWLYDHANVAVLLLLIKGVDSMQRLDDNALVAQQFGNAELDFRIMNNTAVLEFLKQVNYQMPIPFTATPEEVGTSFVSSTMKFDTNASVSASETTFDFEPFYVNPDDTTVDSEPFSTENFLRLEPL